MLKALKNTVKLNIFIVCLLLMICSLAEAKDYDGLFFLGLNLHKDVFNDKNIRYAINYAIDRKYIAREIMSEEVVPTGVIPPGLSGYEASPEGFSYDPVKAKKLLKKPLGMELLLLHTDGVKTLLMAQKIKKDLAAVGIKVKTQSVDYSDQRKWEGELRSGRQHLFLMGYKADFYKITEEVNAKTDTLDLIEPLFSSDGTANFTYYDNRRVDGLLDQVAELDRAVSSVRDGKLAEINRAIMKDAPTVNLFYIPKL